MPIKGLEERIRLGFPRIGKLKKGDKKEVKTSRAGKVYETWGKDLEWFRFVTERADVFEAFRRVYGDQPDSLEITLPFTTAAQNFEHGFECYKAGGLQFLCDEENMYLWRGDDGRMYTEAKPCPYHSGQLERTDSDPGDVPFGRLTVILPGLLAEGFVGHVTIETHAWNDILSILGSLLYMEQLRAGNEMGLRGIHWRLYRVPERISTPFSKTERKKRARREKWLVKIEPTARYVQAQLAAAEEASLLPEPTVAARLERLAMQRIEREAGEILTPYGMLNAAHMVPDPASEAPPLSERDKAPVMDRPHGRLFAQTGPGDVGYKPGNGEAQEAPIEGEYSVPEEPPEIAATFDPTPEAQGAATAVVLPEMPKQEQPHWIDVPTLRDKFWAQTTGKGQGSLGLNKDQVYDAVNLGRLHDFRGTYDDAIKVVEAYAKKVQAKQQAAKSAQAEMPL